MGTLCGAGFFRGAGFCFSVAVVCVFRVAAFRLGAGILFFLVAVRVPRPFGVAGFFLSPFFCFVLSLFALSFFINGVSVRH